MCYNCGCKRPFDDHGDPRNLVEKHLVESAATEAMEGADLAKAKEYTLELLRLQAESGELGAPKEQY